MMQITGSSDVLASSGRSISTDLSELRNFESSTVAGRDVGQNQTSSRRVVVQSSGLHFSNSKELVLSRNAVDRDEN